MIIPLAIFLWIFFISLIYLDIPPLIMGLSSRGLEVFLDPRLTLAGLILGEAFLLWWLARQRKEHGYNVPFYLASMATLAVLLGSFVSPPLMMVAVIFQAVALYLDIKACANQEGMAK